MNELLKTKKKVVIALLFIAVTGATGFSYKMKPNSNQNNLSSDVNIQKETGMKNTGAFLEISLKVNEENRAAAAGVYMKYKEPFLDKIEGSTSKQLLLRGEDVQVLHGFVTEEQAKAYLSTSLFANDIVGELGPLLAAEPEVRVYAVFDGK